MYSGLLRKSNILLSFIDVLRYSTPTDLVKNIHEKLTDKDKTFLLSVKNVTPDWSIYNFERFPALSWKLQNLQKLKERNPDKHREQYELLQNKLDMITKK